jgi:hypothetical protein
MPSPCTIHLRAFGEQLLTFDMQVHATRDTGTNHHNPGADLKDRDGTMVSGALGCLLSSRKVLIRWIWEPSIVSDTHQSSKETKYTLGLESLYNLERNTNRFVSLLESMRGDLDGAVYNSASGVRATAHA